MRIKLFIITYNNAQDLNANLRSLFASDMGDYKVEVNIINNHSDINIEPEFQDKVAVYNNVLRPDFSTGHLARNWNQAIINGFKDLTNPDCDILITCQDDSIFDYNWLTYLLDLHTNFNFIQMGIGDNFCSYLPDAIRIMGLWDERFCGIGYQEADYFLRALIYNRSKSCLNDYQHGRLINPVNFTLCSRPAAPDVFSTHHQKSMKFHAINEKVFNAKWPGATPNYWALPMIHNPPTKSAIHNFITYPYFEKDIHDLTGKNYIV
jgi:hypothetical protein